MVEVTRMLLQCIYGMPKQTTLGWSGGMLNYVLYSETVKPFWGQSATIKKVGTQGKGGWHCASLLHGTPLQLHTLRKTASFTTTTTKNCHVKSLVACVTTHASLELIYVL